MPAYHMHTGPILQLSSLRLREVRGPSKVTGSLGSRPSSGQSQSHGGHGAWRSSLKMLMSKRQGLGRCWGQEASGLLRGHLASGLGSSLSRGAPLPRAPSIWHPDLSVAESWHKGYGWPRGLDILGQCPEQVADLLRPKPRPATTLFGMDIGSQCLLSAWPQPSASRGPGIIIESKLHLSEMPDG